MIRLEKVSKTYDQKEIWKDFSYVFEDGQIYAMMGPSGSGKTTMLKMLAGLTAPDSGRIDYVGGRPQVSVMFQENRLFEEFSLIENLKAVLPEIPEEELKKESLKLLGEEELDIPVKNFSGGMKRRAALIRAMLYDGNPVLLDEPFTGLDSACKELCKSFIMEHVRGRILVMALHSAEDAASLHAITID